MFLSKMLVKVCGGVFAHAPLWTMGVSAIISVQVACGEPALADSEVLRFTDRYCSSCHNDVDEEGWVGPDGVDLHAVGPGQFSNMG